MSSAWRSAFLLILVSLVLVLGAGLACAGLKHSLEQMPWPAISIILGSFWVGWLATAFRSSAGDRLLLPLAASLCSLGWLEVYRLGPDIDMPGLEYRQAIWIAVGMAVFVLITWLVSDYRVLEDYKYLCFFCGVLLQASVMVFGTEVNGARLWFHFGGVSLQPIELVKLLVVIFLAAFLRQFRHWIRLSLVAPEGRLSRKALLLLGMGMAFAEGILVVQKDLGMALLLFGIFLSMFYVATGRRDLIAIGGVLSAGGAWLCYKLFGHVRVRVGAWLDPFRDAQGEGYQMCHALYALANGGLDGTGLGLGSPYLVLESHTDFIFVAIAEELGMLGACALIVLFMLLVSRGFVVAMQVRDEFGTILAAGLSSLLAWQSLIIILGTTKLAPMTGITLPFVSYGGSSMLANFAALGLIWVISAAAEANNGD